MSSKITYIIDTATLVMLFTVFGHDTRDCDDAETF